MSPATPPSIIFPLSMGSVYNHPRLKDISAKPTSCVLHFPSTFQCSISILPLLVYLCDRSLLPICLGYKYITKYVFSLFNASEIVELGASYLWQWLAFDICVVVRICCCVLGGVCVMRLEVIKFWLVVRVCVWERERGGCEQVQV